MVLCAPTKKQVIKLLHDWGQTFTEIGQTLGIHCTTVAWNWKKVCTTHAYYTTKSKMGHLKLLTPQLEGVRVYFLEWDGKTSLSCRVHEWQTVLQNPIHITPWIPLWKSQLALVASSSSRTITQSTHKALWLLGVRATTSKSCRGCLPSPDMNIEHTWDFLKHKLCAHNPLPWNLNEL